MTVALHAEQALLGALLADSRTAWPLVSGVVRPEDFEYGQHPAIFEAIAGLCRAGSLADPISVAAALDGGGKTPSDERGIAHLSRLARDVLTSSNAGEYAALVRAEASRRELRRTLTAALEHIDARAPAEIAGELQRRIADAVERAAARSDVGMLDAARDALEDFDRRAELARQGKQAGISTGLHHLDRAMGGLEPGLVVLAALTSAGKSALAWHAALGAALRGEAVGIVSLEMTARELARRAYSRVHGVPLGPLMRGEPGALDRLLEAEMRTPVSQLPVWIDDGASTIDEVCGRITAWRARHGIRLAVVDYLQLVESAGAETRQLEVAKVSRALKRLSLRLQIPILALSQFNRGAAQAGERPQLHHLRDSGAVEQDADVVAVLWRTAAQTDADRAARPRQLNLTLLKARNGRTGDVYSAAYDHGPLVFETDVQRFREFRPDLDGGIDGGTAGDVTPMRTRYGSRANVSGYDARSEGSGR